MVLQERSRLARPSVSTAANEALSCERSVFVSAILPFDDVFMGSALNGMTTLLINSNRQLYKTVASHGYCY